MSAHNPQYETVPGRWRSSSSLRLRRRTEARSRNDEGLTVLIVLVFGILVAPTGFGQGVLGVVGELVSGINDSSR
ncbi:hypothetical protein ACPZ13_00330 [Streptomyces sp. IPPR8]|uniref:hypothetical protein n=1 Tax=Streptomyces sp. IPPR8 TaxID=3417301 RepID=UPI003D699E53